MSGQTSRIVVAGRNGERRQVVHGDRLRSALSRIVGSRQLLTVSLVHYGSRETPTVVRWRVDVGGDRWIEVPSLRSLVREAKRLAQIAEG